MKRKKLLLGLCAVAALGVASLGAKKNASMQDKRSFVNVFDVNGQFVGRTCDYTDKGLFHNKKWYRADKVEGGIKLRDVQKQDMFRSRTVFKSVKLPSMLDAEDQDLPLLKGSKPFTTTEFGDVLKEELRHQKIELASKADNLKCQYRGQLIGRGLETVLSAGGLTLAALILKAKNRKLDKLAKDFINVRGQLPSEAKYEKLKSLVPGASRSDTAGMFTSALKLYPELPKPVARVMREYIKVAKARSVALGFTIGLGIWTGLSVLGTVANAIAYKGKERAGLRDELSAIAASEMALPTTLSAVESRAS